MKAPAPILRRRQNNFKRWWICFKAFATIKNFAQAIERTPKMDLPKDETTDVSTDKPKKLAKDRNLIAIACLTDDFQDHQSSGNANKIE
jgi:hypothetical protein